MQDFVLFKGENTREDNAFYGYVGDARISPIDVGDVARLEIRVLTEAGHEDDAPTGPASITQEDIAEIATQTLDRTIRSVCISDEAYRQATLAVGYPRNWRSRTLTSTATSVRARPAI